jgi:hypothetical protein
MIHRLLENLDGELISLSNSLSCTTAPGPASIMPNTTSRTPPSSSAGLVPGALAEADRSVDAEAEVDSRSRPSQS